VPSSCDSQCEEQSREAVNQMGCVKAPDWQSRKSPFYTTGESSNWRTSRKNAAFDMLQHVFYGRHAKKLHNNEFGERPGSFLSWWSGWNWKCWISRRSWISFEDVFFLPLVDPLKNVITRQHCHWWRQKRFVKCSFNNKARNPLRHSSFSCSQARLCIISHLNLTKFNPVDVGYSIRFST
jgi:hypothetical protein